MSKMRSGLVRFRTSGSPVRSRVIAVALAPVVVRPEARALQHGAPGTV